MIPAHAKEKSNQKSPSTRKYERVKFIHQIQKSQGDFPCFRTGYNYFCDSSKCVWRNECMNIHKKIGV